MTLACPIKLIKSEKRFCNNKGFTVVELLVVVGIIAVLTTIGVASYNNFNDRKVLESAVEELKSNLRLAQSKAINNEKDSNLDRNFCCTYIWSDNFYRMRRKKIYSYKRLCAGTTSCARANTVTNTDRHYKTKR